MNEFQKIFKDTIKNLFIDSHSETEPNFENILKNLGGTC